SGVSETLSVQFVPAGAAIGAIASPLGASGVSPVPPQAASARASGAAHRVKAKRCKVDDIGRIPFRIWRRLDDGDGALKRGPPVSTVAAHGDHELLWRTKSSSWRDRAAQVWVPGMITPLIAKAGVPPIPGLSQSLPDSSA